MEEEIKKLLDQRTKLENQKIIKKERLAENLAGMDADFEQYKTDDILTKDKQQAMYEKEKNAYKQEAEAEISKIESDIDKKNDEIVVALKEMRDELVVEANQKHDYSEKEKALTGKEIELKIAKETMEEAEAEYNHQMMKFYYYDDKSAQKLDDSEVLSAKKDYNELLVEFNSMLRELNTLKARDAEVVKNLNSKIDRINQFFGKVDVKETSADKILEAIGDEEFEVQIPLNTKQQPSQETAKTQQAQSTQKKEKENETEAQATENETKNNKAEKKTKKLSINKLAESGIKAEDIEIAHIDFDISTGKIAVMFTANNDAITINVDMGKELLSAKKMNKYLEEINIGIEGKMDPYITYAIEKSSKEVMRGLGIIDRAKINDFSEKHMDTYKKSLETKVKLQELKDEKLESLTGIRYFKSEEKCDKNNFKYLMPYMRAAKESTCSKIEVDTRKWYEILRDKAKYIFNKTLGLSAGEQKPQSTQTQEQQGQGAVQKNTEGFGERIQVLSVKEKQERTDEAINNANQELAKTLLNSSARNIANENIKAAANKVKAEKDGPEI